jgi:hypothetical protein
MNQTIRTYKLGNGTTFTEIYDNNNKLHFDNGPAVVSQTTKEWYKHGLKHRSDGYAVIIKKDDYLHHDVNNPAIVDSNGCMEWWIEGIQQRIIK